MPSPPSVSTSDWNNVRQSLDQIRTNYDDFDRFFGGVFERLDEVAVELTSRQKKLAAQRELAEVELRRQKAELAEAERQLELQREEFRATKAAGTPAACKDHVAEINRLERERDEFLHRQQILEAELDTVRSRAAELAEQLDRQQAQWASERTKWTEELRQMRCGIEALTQQRVEPATVEPYPESEAVPPASEEDLAEESDPVLGSIMAQFELLQKDVAGRRQRAVGTD